MRLPGTRENYGMPHSRSARIWLSVFQFRSSILSKLVVSFVAITAFAVGVISVVEYFVAKDVVEKTVIADLRAIATIQSEQREVRRWCHRWVVPRDVPPRSRP